MVNIFYDQNSNDHTLPTSRVIPQQDLRYINGEWMKETAEGPQAIRFRGVNLPAKTPSVPSNLRDTSSADQLYESKRNLSFVGRPFPLDEAHIHFKRISHHWGFNLIRLSTSWEAVMHEGPGVIDHDYLAYLKEFVILAGEYGLYVLIDPHQDVWSRYSGGDGAPWWTLDAAGFDTDSSALHDTGSAVLHQQWNASEWGEMPRMTWTNNIWKLATATMFTLFFAGDTYAPGITVGDMTIQQFLQFHYFEFISVVARAVSDCPNVIGFGTMNEPSSGFLGVEDINEIHAPTLHGHVLSGYESMRLGSGESLEVPYYPSHFRYEAHHILNPSHKRSYRTPELDIWQRVGVYKIDEQTGQRILLRPNHFALKPGEDFTDTYLMPFYQSVQQTISRHSPKFHVVAYAEPYIDPTDPYPSAPSSLIGQGVNKQQQYGWAPHWYDAVTLFLGYSKWVSFDFEWILPAITPWYIGWTFRKNLRRIKDGKDQQSEVIHVIVGETGVPFSGSETDYSLSLDRTLRAMEANDIDYVIWCYETGNEYQVGDLWNKEDLSLLSSGKGRGLQAAVRPWPHQYSSGLKVVSQKFDLSQKKYDIDFREDGPTCKECVAKVFLFVPSCHFIEPEFLASTGKISYDRSSQELEWEIHGRLNSSIYSMKIVESDESR